MLNILHIDLGKQWRGGQHQVLILLKYLRKICNNFIACFKSSPLYFKIKNLNIPIVELQSQKWKRISDLNKLKHLIKSQNVQIIHTHCAKSLTIGAILKKFNPKVFHIHTRRVDFDIKSNIFSKWRYIKGIDKIIAISSAVKNVLIKNGVPEEKITLIPSAIDTEEYENLKINDIKKEFNLKENSIIIVSVGNYVDHKGHIYLVESVPHILNNFPDTYVFIVGEGPERKNLESLISKLYLRKHVFLTGFREDPLSFIAQADLYVQPSKYEGLGTSLLDAMALGKPCVATKTGGIVDIIEDGFNGILAQPQDCVDLAFKIIQILENDKLRKQIAFNAKNFIKQKFDIKIISKKIYSLYKQISGYEN